MTHVNYHYAPVAEAIKRLRDMGFAEDFNLGKDCLICNDAEYRASQFDVAEVYRYEGDTDPADEATVYGIVSANGLKGVLVTAYGAASDPMSADILEKLTIRPEPGASSSED